MLHVKIVYSDENQNFGFLSLPYSGKDGENSDNPQCFPAEAGNPDRGRIPSPVRPYGLLLSWAPGTLPSVYLPI